MEYKYYSLREPLKHRSLFPWECSWITSISVCLEQKPFLLADSIFQVFLSTSLNAFVEWYKTKFARSFFPAFFCSSAIAKSLVSVLILFSTINSDIFKLDSLLSFFVFPVLFILLFVFFSLLIFYDRHLYIVLFEKYLFTLNLDELEYTLKPTHQTFLSRKMLSRIFGWSLLTLSNFQFAFVFRKSVKEIVGQIPSLP